MNRKRILWVFSLSISAIFFGYCGFSYGYVEPVRKILPRSADVDLTDPDLPQRKGLKLPVSYPFSSEELGEIILHAAVSTGVTIDPNVYLSRQNEKYDIIYKEALSFGVEIPFKKHKLSMDYEATEYHYERYDINDHVNQRVRGLLDIELTDYRITLSDTFRNYTSLPGSENSTRLKQDSNELRLGIIHETSKFGFDVGYSNNVHHYYSDDVYFNGVSYRDRSSMKHIADMTVAYRQWPKTAIVVENDFGISDANGPLSPDYYFNDLLFGIRGELFKKLTTNFQAGYRYQYFRESTVLFDDTISSPICRGGLKYAASEEDVIDLGIQRSFEDSNYQSNSYYAANFIGLNYTHVFTSKISGKAFGTYQRNDYPTETTEGVKTAKRHDNAYGAGFSISYNIRRWLTAEIGYELKKARSNFRIFDYEDNLASFKVTAGF